VNSLLSVHKKINSMSRVRDEVDNDDDSGGCCVKEQYIISERDFLS
jgi:hypothetical protein